MQSTALNLKKSLNIPDDGTWIIRFDTRSEFEKFQRYINERKFYATLSRQLTVAEEEWFLMQPSEEELREFTEILDGPTPLGGEMRVRLKTVTNLKE